MKEAKTKVKQEETEWDKKKIILFLVGVFILIAIIFEAKDLILGRSVTPSPKITAPDIKGAATQIAPSVKQTVQNQLENLQTEAEKINVVEIATSSPQVQKVINDLKEIQNYPQNQLKTTCEQICNSL